MLKCRGINRMAQSKIIMVLLCLVGVLIVTISGCAHRFRFEESQSEKLDKVHVQLKKAICKNDRELLLDLFSSNAKAGIQNINEKLDGLMNYCNFTIESEEEYQAISAGNMGEWNEYTEWEHSMGYLLKTDKGNYVLGYDYCSKDKYHPDNIGLYSLLIVPQKEYDSWDGSGPEKYRGTKCFVFSPNMEE